MPAIWLPQWQHCWPSRTGRHGTWMPSSSAKGQAATPVCGIGIVSAKAFAYATGCALIAVETFATIARQAPVETDHLDVITDAQQDKIYVQRGVRQATTDSWVLLPNLKIQTFL